VKNAPTTLLRPSPGLRATLSLGRGDGGEGFWNGMELAPTPHPARYPRHPLPQKGRGKSTRGKVSQWPCRYATLFPLTVPLRGVTVSPFASLRAVRSGGEPAQGRRIES